MATHASLQQSAGSGAEHEQQLSDLHCRCLDLQLELQMKNIDIAHLKESLSLVF
jgi:hypothetical protein